MKVGIVIPCHVEDMGLLAYCLNSVKQLSPKPYRVFVDINDADSLKEVRVGLFDRLFSVGCDVVVSCDADFYLHRHVLKHVSGRRVTSFAQFEGNLGDLQQAFVRLFWRRCWSGLYSIPAPLWSRIKELWDGSDGSVHAIVGDDYKFVRRFCYTPLRPKNTFSILKAVRKRLC